MVAHSHARFVQSRKVFTLSPILFKLNKPLTAYKLAGIGQIHWKFKLFGASDSPSNIFYFVARFDIIVFPNDIFCFVS